MANKPTYTTVPTNSQYSAAIFNSNFEKMAVAIQNVMGLGGIGEPNNVATGIWDLDTYRIQNVGDPVNSGDAISKSYGDTNYGGGAAAGAEASAAAALVSETNAAISEDAASSSAASASSSEANAASSEAACANYSSIGFDTAGAYDFGAITDTVLLFPTDFGSIV
jgi:hypothetical protein